MLRPKKNYHNFLIKFLKFLYRGFKRVSFYLLFQNSLMKYPEYREIMNKFYRKFIYNTLLEPKKKYLISHKNHQYLNEVKLRFKSKKNIQNNIEKFDINLKIDYPSFFKVNIKKMVGDNGSRFCSSGDPLTNTALQLIKNKNIEIKDLLLYKYFKSFNPKNLSEVFLIKKKSKLDQINSYNLFYPWHTAYPPPDAQNMFFGPKLNHNEDIKLRSIRIKNIYDLINKYGYIPDENDCIDGYILINEHDYRFVVTAGHHRSSVLNAMNILGNFSNEVTVRFDFKRIRNKYFIVNKEHINEWPSVKNKFLSKHEAILIFDSFFNDKIYF